MRISRTQLVEAHLDHPVKIPEDRFTDLDWAIYDAVKASPGERLIIGNQQARIEHRSGRRAVHWRRELEKVKGQAYAEKVLTETLQGEDKDVLVFEELPLT